MLNDPLMKVFIGKWLKAITVTDSIQTFLTIISHYLNSKECIYLQTDVNGRTLQCLDMNGEVCVDNNNISFYVNDFTHPFSHVIQTKKAKKITSKGIHYWRDHSQFCHFIGNGKNEDYWIFPIHDDKKIYGLFFIVLATSQLCLIEENEDWKWLLELFLIRIIEIINQNNIDKKNKYLAEALEKNRDKETSTQFTHKINQGIVGETPAVKQMIKDIVRISPTKVNVLIHGDSGVGKELVAQAVHSASTHKDGPFVAINCAGFPSDLFESELFGYTKGAFTGAESDREGLIAAADKGTLFLDEIGDMPYKLQAKLLRVIETRKYRPIGSNEERESSFRLVAATHVNLKELIAKNAFRKDLFFRVSQYTISVPSLTERREDLSLLIEHFIKKYNTQYQKSIIGIDYEALSLLKEWDFPGNIRELKNLIESACMLTDKNILDQPLFLKLKNHQNLEIVNSDGHRMNTDTHSKQTEERNKQNGQNDRVEQLLVNILTNNEGLRETMSYIEKTLIQEILIQNKFNKKKSAEVLQLPLRTFSYKCNVYDI